ncbi:MAG TPA: DUF3883 domain-containing protein [Tepidisphaeraceae bacterium]|jgi:hypothetical protein
MPTESPKRLLETSALIVGYAMSRLDHEYLAARNCKTWKDAFDEAGGLLKIVPTSLKNLRDEFDPVHGNARRGWWKRPPRPDRQRVMGELCEVSDRALVEMVDRILRHDDEALQEVVRPLSKPARTKQLYNVAERLRTGGLAERYFMENSAEIVDVQETHLLDHRTHAGGYDFGVKDRPNVVIEVKGLKHKRGGILFTDREWSEALLRRIDYWLVLVGNLETKPVARVMRNPTAELTATCRYHTTITATWQANVVV